MRKAKTSDAMEWIRAKLSQLAAREAEPPPVAASRPKATPPRKGRRPTSRNALPT